MLFYFSATYCVFSVFQLSYQRQLNSMLLLIVVMFEMVLRSAMARVCARNSSASNTCKIHSCCGNFICSRGKKCLTTLILKFQMTFEVSWAQITEHLEIRNWDCEGGQYLWASNAEQKFTCAHSSLLLPVVLKRQVVAFIPTV